jgi:transcription initiation factor IIE alpha subunit
MRGDGKNKVLDAMKFTAKTTGDGLTAYTLARVTGLSAQHVNKILAQLYHEGAVGFKQSPYRKTFRREWATVGRCKKLIKQGHEWHVTEYALRQMELPL